MAFLASEIIAEKNLSKKKGGGKTAPFLKKLVLKFLDSVRGFHPDFFFWPFKENIPKPEKNA